MYIKKSSVYQRLGSWEHNPQEVVKAAEKQEKYVMAVEWMTSPIKMLAKKGARYLAHSKEEISDTKKTEAIVLSLLRQHGLIR